MYLRPVSPESNTHLQAMYRADGTQLRVITDEIDLFYLFWTPDSRQILFERFDNTQNQIVAVDLAGNWRTIIATDDSLGSQRQHISPISSDGELVAWPIQKRTSTPEDRGQIVVYDMRLAGSAPHSMDGSCWAGAPPANRMSQALA